ncbi:hypothetical protein LV84_03470 [Algoriphagus ratkowskyi]|uniref:Uncharacterized protein n=1 Tax=Algoriphagus ratkowskyi TaxID=57028 RepID=A0A2W7QW12_9BACT|nr:hypothetical protein [Algoriphagus ratkowskyi]PZX52464.1 hypothetical protein LV84_03470 [Algoriphagus ratkowskyi]TXD76192.1 hypothetical protein ESW18_17325 [Algoriphagus ratkowskyi]
MIVSKNEKARILEAYFEKSISKGEMEKLLQEGITIPPIDWVYSNEDDKLKKEQRRQLIEKVFKVSFPKIEWV